MLFDISMSEYGQVYVLFMKGFYDSCVAAFYMQKI